MLTADDQRALFTLVRESIRAHLLGEPPPELPEGSEELGEVRGVFVTLRSDDGQLRGCIGHIVGQSPLAEAVRDLAVSAAFRDRRFPPLKMHELGSLEIELSVLSPLGDADPAKIEIGKHGLMIRLRDSSGLLLPQVATDRNWDAVTFLENTCRKASLPKTAWKDPAAELFWFSCDIYEEADTAA